MQKMVSDALEVLRHLHQMAPWAKGCYILSQNATFARNCAEVAQIKYILLLVGPNT